MPEYISRDEVNNMLEQAQLISDECGEYCGYCTEDIDISAIPTADVAPVVHGKWTTHRTEKHDGEWYCTECDYEPEVFTGSNFCPNCGAKMVLEE